MTAHERDPLNVLLGVLQSADTLAPLGSIRLELWDSTRVCGDRAPM